MKLLFILFVLASKFKKSSKSDENFKKFLMGHKYDAAMVWANAAVGFAAMKKGEEGIMEALKNHRVYIEGQLHSFTWFGAAINYVMQ